GEVVVITGRNLSGSSAALQLAASVEILLDGRVLAPESVSATEVRVRIPLDVSPGPHTLSVRVDGRTSNSVQFTVEVFTVTGTYQGPGRIASATCNDPAVQAELQQLFPPGATGEGIQAVRDRRRPRFQGS
ncbi:MAG: IPT/TIG domain-containing protein, partial [Actinobacteria bacterium]|nr:IPT/TIG domain-containing protein [Actinomycetota bacterium]